MFARVYYGSHLSDHKCFMRVNLHNCNKVKKFPVLAIQKDTLFTKYVGGTI